MKKDSILFSITNFFIISIISIVAFFFILILLDLEKEDRLQSQRVYRAIKTLNIFERYHYSGESLNEQLKTLELRVSNPFVVVNLDPYKIIDDRIYMELFERGKHHYIKVITPRKSLYVFEDLQANKEYFPYLLIGMIISIVIIILSYMAIIKKLNPLKELEKNVVKFGQGDLNITTKVLGDDEISRLSRSFNQAISNIKNLKNSRDFFIRNIMHELKTPIAKGKITLELLDDKKNKDRFVKVFNRLEILINELASVESVISGAKTEDRREYRIADIIDGAKDLLFEQNINIVTENIDKTILVDYELFTIVFKNLIDNGFKYSIDKQVSIRVLNDNLEFINSGKKMEKTLEEHTKPFEKTKSDGFGLGLYIVDTILNNHNIKLEYRYEEGKSIFYFKL